jgi:RNA polymerase sigma factor (sigma-70 family)
VSASWSVKGNHFGRALFQSGRLGDLSDAELIRRSLSPGPEPRIAEMAFATLVQRHGPMVYRVCRTTLGNHHDAEDAFQATFLVLVREARRLRVRDSLGPWLYEVARRVSLFARTARMRRRRHEHAAAMLSAEGVAAGPGAGDQLERDESALTIQSEIARLPERFRACLILCDLQGLTYAETARQLGVPVGTVQSRLARARKRLRQCLARRGLDPGVATRLCPLVTMGGPPVNRAPAAHLLARTSSLCLQFAAARSPTTSTIPASIVSLVKGSSRIMVLSRPGLGAVASMVLLSSALAVYSQTGKPGRLQPADGQVRPSAQSPANREFNPPSPIVPPRELSAAAGRGKVLVYELTAGGERNPAKPEVYKEVTLETSWVVVTGSVPDFAILANLRGASALAEPMPTVLYRRVELQRQVRQVNGSWSAWSLLDLGPTLKILDNLPEEDEEQVPGQFRPETLCDPLPHLTEGQWRGVNVARFLSRRDDRPEQLPPPALLRDRIPESSPAELMMRRIDFSVVPGQTYRYRARLVILARRQGPRLDASGEWAGDWSEPTQTVIVP